MHLLRDTRGKVRSGPRFRWPPGSWPETGVPFISAGEDTEAGHWTSKAGHRPLHLMPPASFSSTPRNAGPGPFPLDPSDRRGRSRDRRPHPAPSRRVGWQVLWSASGQAAGRGRHAPRARRQLPLGCGLPGASGSGASSASIASPDAMCCLAVSQQMPRRALSCCPAGNRTDSVLCAARRLLWELWGSGHPQRVRQGATHPLPPKLGLPFFTMVLVGAE